MIRKAILRRTAAGIATLFLVSILVFIGTSVLPGDIAQILLGQMGTPETLAALRAKLGLDQPAHIRYFQWLGDLLTGDLGISKAGGSTISSIIHGRLSNTVWLAALVALIAIPVSLALGLLTAMYPGTRLDRTVTFCTLSLISVPEFLVATCLVLILAVHLRWLPSIAYMSGNETGWQLIKAMAMPILTLVIVVSAQIIRMTRATVLNVLSSPYIEMAILKGVPRRRIILRHALRNAMGPIVNVIALNMAWLISGIVIVETIFAYPGLAKLMIDAVQIRDLPLVQAIAMIFCASYVVLIFVADMASILSNPRMRHPK
jgi:peptide/nickel transport system permease protein